MSKFNQGRYGGMKGKCVAQRSRNLCWGEMLLSQRRHTEDESYIVNRLRRQSFEETRIANLLYFQRYPIRHSKTMVMN